MPITREALQYLAQRFDTLYQRSSEIDRSSARWQKIHSFGLLFHALTQEIEPNAVQERMIKKYEPWIPETFESIIRWLKQAEQARQKGDKISATRLEKQVVEFMGSVSLPSYSQALEFTRVEVLLFDIQRFSYQLTQFLKAYRAFQQHAVQPEMGNKVDQLLTLLENFFADLLPNEDLLVIELIETFRLQLMDIDALLQIARKYQGTPTVRAALESAVIVCAMSLESTLTAIHQQRKQLPKPPAKREK